MTLDPNLIAALIRVHTAAADPVALAAAIVQAHETRAQIARLDRDHSAAEQAHRESMAAFGRLRRGIQERCGHPATSPVYNGHANEGRRCDVCEAEL